jgi:hypothetical protein
VTTFSIFLWTMVTGGFANICSKDNTWLEKNINKLVINWSVILCLKRILDDQKFNSNLTAKTCSFHFAKEYNKNKKDPTKMIKIHFNE